MKLLMSGVAGTGVSNAILRESNVWSSGFEQIAK
jgi:hypothetical protein